jgi:hypothetical protein
LVVRRLVRVSKRPMMAPSGPMRNLLKFHVMSPGTRSSPRP